MTMTTTTTMRAMSSNPQRTTTTMIISIVSVHNRTSLPSQQSAIRNITWEMCESLNEIGISSVRQNEGVKHDAVRYYYFYNFRNFTLNILTELSYSFVHDLYSQLRAYSINSIQSYQRQHRCRRSAQNWSWSSSER